MNDKGLVLWFTGRSSSGKTTLTGKLCSLLEKDIKVQVLDSDTLQTWLFSGLMTRKKRRKIMIRISKIAEILANQNVTILVSHVARNNELRNLARTSLGDRYYEVYVKCSLETCIKRRAKNPHKKKRFNNPLRFKIFDHFEEPISPDFVIDTEHDSVDDKIKEIQEFIYSKKSTNDE